MENDIKFISSIPSTIDEQQREWELRGNKFACLDLAKLLQEYNYEEYYENLLDNILGPKFRTARQSGRGITQWSVADVETWILSLVFLKDSRFAIAKVIRREWIDGDYFMSIDEKTWLDLELDCKSYFLLSCIRDGWLHGWGPCVPCAVENCPSTTESGQVNGIMPYSSASVQSMLIDDSACDMSQTTSVSNNSLQDIQSKNLKHRSNRQNSRCSVAKPPSVIAGIRADLSNCSSEIVRNLIDADNAAIRTGEGMVYGQLVVLGYKEYKTDGNLWEPIGINNQKFVMKRRKVPNGKRIEFTENNNEFVYTSDPTFDMFQIGRMEFTNKNDFIVHGALHMDKNGHLSSPVSRFACRIYSSRVPPFKSYIYAAGFDENDSLFLGEGAKIFKIGSDTDAMTTFGVHIYNPSIGEWCELSVKGSLYSMRQNNGDLGRSIGISFTNEIVSGSIIDVCGVRMLFQNMNDMVSAKAISPQILIDQLNSLKPQCPVLMHGIKFAYIDPRERAKRELKRLQCLGKGFLATTSIHIPLTDYSDIEENHRSFVFPACGHVHGYHKSLVGKSCPLCRKNGPFVPIAFEFEPAICQRKPTHVFNPCGHVASREVCEYWSSTPVLVNDSSDRKFRRLSFSCPFCGFELSDNSHGGPFNRLMLQTESGESWENEIETMDFSQVEKCETTQCSYSPFAGTNSEEIDGNTYFPKYTLQFSD